MLLLRTSQKVILGSVESDVNLYSKAGSPKDARNVYLINTANKTGSNGSVTYATATYVGGQVNTFVTTASTTINFNLSGGLASAPSADDIVIVAFATGSTANRDMTITANGGSTTVYTELADLYSNDGSDTNLGIYYKKMESSVDTGIIMPSGSFASGDAGAIAIHVWRNVTLDQSIQTTATIDTAIPNPPAITTQAANAIVIAIAASAHTRGANTYTASELSNFVTAGRNGTQDVTIGMGSYLQATAGSFDPAAWTISSFTDATTFTYAAATLSLRPLFSSNTTGSAAVTSSSSWKPGSTVYFENASGVTCLGGSGIDGAPGIGGAGGAGGSNAGNGTAGSAGGAAGSGTAGKAALEITPITGVQYKVNNLGTLQGGAGGTASTTRGGGGGGGGKAT